MPDEKQRRMRRWKTILTAITIFALVALVYAVREQLAATIENLHRVNVWLVLLVVPMALTNHLSAAKLYQGLFRVLGERFRTRSMFRLSLEMNFINAVFPSAGVSGFSYIALRLKSEKISTAQASLVQLMRFVLIFIGFQFLLFSGLLALAIGGRANDIVLLIAGSLATLVLIGTAILTFIVGSRVRINWFFRKVTRLVNRVIHIFRRAHPETINLDKMHKTVDELHDNYMNIRRNLGILRKPLLFALGTNVIEICAIYSVYLAFGEVVNPGAVILAYAIANFAGLVSVLPGGVGIYEGLMTAVLAAGGIPPSVSLPVTVMFRLTSMATQLPLGYFFYQKNLHANSKMETAVQAMKHESKV